MKNENVERFSLNLLQKIKPCIKPEDLDEVRKLGKAKHKIGKIKQSRRICLGLQAEKSEK